MADVLPALLSVVRARLNDSSRDWLDTAVTIARTGDVHRLCASYTGTARHLGSSPISLTAAERSQLSALVPPLNVDRWTVSDVARVVILLTAATSIGQDAFVELALACFDNGDAREQQSWLRAVSLLPHSDRFTAVAVDACRSHIQPLFESIACENPYPAAYFSDRQFNQLVLKAMFTGVQLERIAGLARRLNADLSRMARDYAAERRAAGRTVPPDLPLALHDAPAFEEHLR